MKTSVGKVLSAALFTLVPLTGFAQNLASGVGVVNRSLERLTLLPGPFLLSPARNMPTMMPSPMKLQTAPSFRFVAPAEEFLTGRSGSLRLINRPVVKPSVSGRIDSAASPRVRPSPDTLRFDSTLKSPATKL